MAISLTICNLALGDLRAPAIADINEQSPEAQLCQRYYPHCLALMFDDWEWQFAKRVSSTLAQLSTNDRASDWAYAFSLPDDCAQALRILPPGTAYSQNLWPCEPVFVPNWQYDFVVEGGNLYTNIDTPILEYAGVTADETKFPPLFREAVAKLLAAKLAVPLRDDSRLEIKLLQQAQAARQSAIANDINRFNHHERVDDVAMARR